MKLYYSPGACSLATHIALCEGDVDFETVRVDLGEHVTETGADYYAINPRGYVPAIEADGLGLVSENPATLYLAAERTGKLPEKADDRIRLIEWLAFINSELHGGFHPLMADVPEEEEREARAKLGRRYDWVVDQMDGRDWLVGDSPTVADNYLYVTTRWAKDQNFELPPVLQDFRARNQERAAVKKALAAEGIDAV